MKRKLFGLIAVFLFFGISRVFAQGVPPVAGQGVPTIAGPHTICTGGSIFLSYDGGGTLSGTFTWTDQFGVVVGTNPTLPVSQPGSYTLTTDPGTFTGTSNPYNVSGVSPPGTPTISGPTSICNSVAITLMATASGASSYQWYLNGTAISGATATTYSTNTAGTYTVVSDNGSCQSAQSAGYVVSANNSPVTPTITGPSVVCNGSPITLDATTPGATSYQWYNNGAPIGGTSATVSITQAGNYTVIAINYCGNSPASAGFTITTNSTPGTPTVSGPTLVCNGSAITLTGTIANASSYQWYLNGTAIGGATSSTLSVTAAGSYTVSASNGCGSSPVSAGYSVTANSTPGTPTVSGPTLVCNGSAITLTGTIANASSYQWYLNGTAIGGATSSTLSVTAAGSYTVSASNNCGTSPVSAGYSVTANSTPAQPIIPFAGSVICNGGTLLLDGTTSGATSYQWYNNGTAISGANSAMYNASAAGTYSVVAINVCGNSPASAGYTLTLSSRPPSAVITGPSVICNGVPITLDATTANTTSYWWIKNGVGVQGFGPSATYVATAPGEYWVNTYNACGIGSRGPSFFVTAAVTPAIPVISGPALICNNVPVTLSTSATGASSYQWFLNGSAIGGATTATYSASTGGTYSVTAISSCGSTGSANYSVSQTNTPATPTITGQSYICPSSTVVLNGTTTYATSYQWYNNGTAISGATAATLNVTAAGNYTAMATSACGNSAASATFPVAAMVVPATPIITGTQTIVCSGSAIVIDGTTPTAASYQWYRNGTAISGATSASYSVTNGGNYTVVAIDACGNSPMSAAYAVSIHYLPTQPVITGQSYVCLGTSIVLDGTTTYAISYQWYKNGVAIPSANSSNISVTTAGNYTVIATDDCGNSPVSNAFPVSLTAPPAKPIISGPLSVCAGSTIILDGTTAAATSYQWSKDGTPISGATSATLMVSLAGNYSVVATDVCGNSPASNPYTVIVTQAPLSPVISGPNSVCAGSTITLDGTSVNTLSYQWYNNGAAISGATSATFSVTSAGNYSVKAVNACGSSPVSSLYTVTASDIPTTPVISGVFTVCAGSTGVLTASSTRAVTYQWYNNGTLIPGATSATLSATSAGNYTVIAMDACGGSPVSAAYPVTLTNVPATPVIAGPTTVCQGSTINLDATTATAISYQWYNGGVAISGATTATLAVTSAGNYTVIAINACGNSVVSVGFAVALTNVPATPVVTGPTSVCYAGSMTLTATSATGTSYQWFKDGNSIPGAISATLNVTAAGIYTALSVNACGTSPVSSPYPVYLSRIPVMPVISGQSFICAGTTVRLDGTTAAATSYQWYNNGTAIGGATAATYDITAAGNYTVVAINTCGNSSTSSSFNVIDGSPVTPVLSAPSTTIVGTQVIQISSTGSGTYAWYKDGVLLTGQTKTSYTTNLAGTYTAITTSSYGCASPVSNPITLTSFNNGTTPVLSVVDPSSPGNTPTTNSNGDLLFAFCQGKTITVTAPQATSYLWSTGATTQSIQVSTAGQFSVTLTINGTVYIPKKLITTVNPLPQTPTVSIQGVGIISGNTTLTVCSGLNNVLTAPAGLAGYQWFKDGSAIATTPSLTVSQAGKYELVVSSTTGCTSPVSYAVIVVIAPLPSTPVLTLVQPTCATATGSITVQPYTNVTYSVDNGINWQTSNVFTNVQPGNYNVIIKSAAGCTSAVTSATINPQPILTGDFTSSNPAIISGSTVSFTAAVPNAVSYTWDFGDGSQSTMANPQHYYYQNGSFTVTLVVKTTFGCDYTVSKAAYVKVAADNYQIVPPRIIAPTTPLYNNNSAFTYPNPFSNVLYVSFDVSIPQTVMVTMRDMRGNLVKSMSFTATTGSNTFQITKFPSMGAGYYILSIQGQSVHENFKILKN